MNENYILELNNLKVELLNESEIAIQKSDILYKEMQNKYGHNQFLCHNINKPIIECEKKYKLKLKKLKEKYNINDEGEMI